VEFHAEAGTTITFNIAFSYLLGSKSDSFKLQIVPNSDRSTSKENDHSTTTKVSDHFTAGKLQLRLAKSELAYSTTLIQWKGCPEDLKFSFG